MIIFKIVSPKEFVKFQLARSYFNLKEYVRASFYLNECESPCAYFLYIYSKYMSIMKKSVDNRADLISKNFEILKFEG
jgi:anaphase-promoting complex subunit 8